jgi:hypothetical protein
VAAAEDDDDVSAADCCGGGVPGVLAAAAEAEEERLRPRVGDETGEGSEGDERDPPAAWNEPGRSGSGVESRLMREATLTVLTHDKKPTCNTYMCTVSLHCQK